LIKQTNKIDINKTGIRKDELLSYLGWKCRRGNMVWFIWTNNRNAPEYNFAYYKQCLSLL